MLVTEMHDEHLLNAIRSAQGQGVRERSPEVAQAQADRLPELLAEAARRGLDPAEPPYRRGDTPPAARARRRRRRRTRREEAR